MNRDLHAVFMRILLRRKALCVVRGNGQAFEFSGMQLDAAVDDAGSWETNHDAIARFYAEAGYDPLASTLTHPGPLAEHKVHQVGSKVLYGKGCVKGRLVLVIVFAHVSDKLRGISGAGRTR